MFQPIRYPAPSPNNINSLSTTIALSGVPSMLLRPLWGASLSQLLRPPALSLITCHRLLCHCPATLPSTAQDNIDQDYHQHSAHDVVVAAPLLVLLAIPLPAAATFRQQSRLDGVSWRRMVHQARMKLSTSASSSGQADPTGGPAKKAVTARVSVVCTHMCRLETHTALHRLATLVPSVATWSP